MKKVFIVLGAVLLLLPSCASGPKVSRGQAGSAGDLSGYWNAADVKEACQALIEDCLKNPRMAQAIMAKGGKLPVVLVGTFKNESAEHIDTSIISTTMETAIFNSGRMDFVAGGTKREELRAERQDQLYNASEATAAALGYEVGADFMLFGTVKTIIDKSGNTSVRTYYIAAEMTSVETNQRLWMGNHEIEKIIVKPKNKL
jgi:uncharacterized protein (TIGR02722 family)